MLITVFNVSPTLAQSNEELGKITLAPKVDSSLIITDSLKANDSLIFGTTTKIDTTISQDALEARVDYEATDSMKIDMVTEKVYLYGAAKVNYENIQLTADYIELDLKNNTVFANGRPDSSGNMMGLPIFNEAGKEYESGKMTYNCLLYTSPSPRD